MVALRSFLETMDVEGLRRAWHALFPAMPQPASREKAEIVMHRARTQAESMTIAQRAYSHRWLVERGLPSGLPDRLKPRAERLYPVTANAVGISVNAKSRFLRPAAAEIRGAMEYAVYETFADGHENEPHIVSARMKEARERTERALFGG